MTIETRRILRPSLAVFVLFFFQIIPCLARAGDAVSEERFQRLNPPLPMDIVTGPAEEIAREGKPLRGPTREHLVKVLYLIPSDRTERPFARAALKSALLLAQRFFRLEMRRNGLGEKTFNIEEDPDQPGTPLVHVFKETHAERDAAWFRAPDSLSSNHRLRQSAAEAGYGTYPAFNDGEVWFIAGDIHQMNADGSFTGLYQSGGASIATGSAGGVCVSQACAMAMAKNDGAYMWDLRDFAKAPVNLGDDLAPYVPGPGPYNLVSGVSNGWNEENTVSQFASTYVGSMVHELSHAFRLYHNYKLDVNYNGNLEGNGFRGFRGFLDHKQFPQYMTHLCYSSARVLNVNRFFRPAMDYPDNTPPTIDRVSSGTVVVDPVTRNLPITITAHDADSNLTMAIVRGAGYVNDIYSVVGEKALGGKSGTWTINIYGYNPNVETSWGIFVYDQSGNVTAMTTKVTAISAKNLAPPIPCFSASELRVGPRQLVLFDARNSLGLVYQASTQTYVADPNAALKFKWDLDGDGIFETDRRALSYASSYFNEFGCHPVRLQVTDPNGGVSTSPPFYIEVTKEFNGILPGAWLTYR